MNDAAEFPETGLRAAEERIHRARTEAEALAETLQREWDGVVDAAASAGSDDEHDPEGPGIAYERERVTALLAHVRSELAALDLAAERLRAGTYATCEVCGGPIAAARLEARPTARTCIGCASATASKGRRRG